MKFLRKAIGYSLVLKTPSKSTKTRRERLESIIIHANETTPYYKGRFTSFLENTKHLNDDEFFYAFRHLPIVEKQDLKDHNEAFASEHLKETVDLLAEGKTPSAFEFLKHAVVKKDFSASLSTGGTSGIPTYRWIDYNDANIFAQSFLHSFKLNGWKPGESFVVYYPLKSYFTGAYAEQAATLQRYFGFTMQPFETVTKESVEALLNTLRKNKASLLVIFPCVLQRVAEIMYRENMQPFTDLACINVSGEFFLDCSKSFIQHMFPDSDIQSTYGAVEFGEIAHQRGLSSFDYDVFDDYGYIEQGPNNSILVTAYQQRAFPLLRYKIEDMGQVVNHKDGSQSITCLEGKNCDYLVGADGYMYFASYFNHIINDINARYNMPIIHFMLRHDDNEHGKVMQLNFVLKKPGKEEKIKAEVMQTVGKTFSNYDHIDVNFPEFFEHDYTRKFKIIGEGDGLAEVVGGYYQRKAS